MLNRNITFEISEKIQRADRDFMLFDGCKKILIALSGGADSCCLLLSLRELCEKYGFSLCAMHVNHGIRGKEADRDEEFARNLCAKLNIPFYCEKADIPSLAKEQEISEELCARNLRYSLFEEYCKKYSFDAVAVAHNSCDNSETVLFNLVRGSSLKGLCGIPPKRPLCKGANIIRPLIYVTRDEIEEYLSIKGQDFVTDSTNLTSDYTRNFLRLEILPKLRQINPSLEEAFRRSSHLLSDDSIFLEKLAKDSETDDVSALCILDKCILSRVIRNMFCRISDDMPQQKHIDALCSKIYSFKENKSLRCSISFPDRKSAHIENGILSFKEDLRTKKQVKNYNISLKEGINIIDGSDFAVFLSFDKGKEIPQAITHNKEIIYKKYTSDYLYSDTIPHGLFAENRKESDTVFLHGMNKSVKRLMCEKKIPVEDRFSLPVIHGEKGEIILIPSVAKSDLFSKTNENSNVISIAVYKRQ